MFDIGMTELLVIGIVALIVVGPKDLPGMFRTLGRFTAKLRGMAREFSRAMEDAADEAGVKDVSKDLKDMTNPKKMGLDRLNEAAEKFEKWDPSKAPKTTATVGPETQKMRDERAAKVEETKAAAKERIESRKADAEPAPETNAPDPVADDPKPDATT